MAGSLKFWDEGPARHIVMGRPEQKNALSSVLLQDLVSAFASPLEGGPKIAFLSGQGSSFSAGADLNEISGGEVDAEYDDQVTGVTDAIAAFPGLVVAIIEGPCVGAAVHLALACDIRIAEEKAVINIPATRLGLLYNPEAIARIQHKVPAETLTRLLVVGERFSANDARDAGLVSEVLKRDQLEERKNQLTEQMAANDANAVALTKSFLRELGQGNADLTQWRQTYLALLGTESRAEAVAKAKAKLGLSNADAAKRAAG